MTPLAVANEKISFLLYGDDPSRLWKFLFYELHQLTTLTWNILTGIQPTIHPNELYERLHNASNQWMQLRGCGNSDDEADLTSQNEVEDETELFARLMMHVKELMSITPA